MPGVYGVAGAPPSWQQTLLAVCLWGGKAVASHRSAAALWQLRGFAPGPLEITTPKQNRRHENLTVHRSTVERRFTCVRDGIPTTTVARTLCDLAAILDRETLRLVRDDALRRRLVSAWQLRWAVRALRAPGREGIRALAALLDEMGPDSGPSASEFQRDVREKLRKADLLQYFIEEQEVTVDGKQFRTDFGGRGHPVVIEADSETYHAGELFVRDLRRRNKLSKVGNCVLHITPVDLDTRGDEFLQDVREALAHFGVITLDAAR
jgi:very-short-patch-repair endonuclease